MKLTCCLLICLVLTTYPVYGEIKQGTSGISAISGAGDMTAATYDPQTIAGDAFDLTLHTGSIAGVTPPYIAQINGTGTGNILTNATLGGTTTLAGNSLVWSGDVYLEQGTNSDFYVGTTSGNVHIIGGLNNSIYACNATTTTVSGVTAKTLFAAGTISANVLAINDHVYIECGIAKSGTNGSGVLEIEIGLGNTEMANTVIGTSNTYYNQTGMFRNLGSTTSQLMKKSWASVTSGGSGAAWVTESIDTRLDIPVRFYVTPVSASDSFTLYSWIVRIEKPRHTQ